ncbi:unnamed protein product [Ambrosiozyma monospora]|uniref:Unnamed protein product n=1 Tax=Ambrosiozyma monospora TaxID=43982 RepID=A0ACB5T109_AMBMO|nr:unnamed protein product [Ambrosiozyma monospora]
MRFSTPLVVILVSSTLAAPITPTSDSSNLSKRDFSLSSILSLLGGTSSTTNLANEAIAGIGQKLNIDSDNLNKATSVVDGLISNVATSANEPDATPTAGTPTTAEATATSSLEETSGESSVSSVGSKMRKRDTSSELDTVTHTIYWTSTITVSPSHTASATPSSAKSLVTTVATVFVQPTN